MVEADCQFLRYELRYHSGHSLLTFSSIDYHGQTPIHFAPRRTSTPVPQDPPCASKKRVRRLQVPQQQRTPLVNELMKRNSTLRKRLKKLEKKYAAKCQESKFLKADSEEGALRVLQDRVPANFFTLLKCQVRNYHRHPRGY